MVVSQHKLEKTPQRRQQASSTPGSQTLLLCQGKEGHDIGKTDLTPAINPSIVEVAQELEQVTAVGRTGIGGKAPLYRDVVKKKVQMGFHMTTVIH